MIRYCLTSYREDLVILDIINDSFSIVPDAGSLLKERDKLLKEFPQLSYFFDSEYHIGSVSRNSDTSFLKNAGFYQNLTKHYISVLYLNDLYYYSKSFTIAGILKKRDGMDFHK